MFFILSKLLMFLIKPVTWIVLALLLALFLKNHKWKQYAFYAGLGILLVFTNPFLNNLAWKAWEAEPVKYEEIDKQYDAVIVLGGYTHSLMKPRDRVHFTAAYDRLSRALELYKLGKADKILLTSGSAQVIGEKVKSSVIIKDHLLRIGIPEADIIIEPGSRNTHENAEYTAKMLKKQYQNGDFLLVTSAFHMYRAKHCFAKEGLKVDTFPADFRSSELNWELDGLLLPSAGALDSWEYLIKEWIGVVAYWVMGYT